MKKGRKELMHCLPEGSDKRLKSRRGGANGRLPSMSEDGEGVAEGGRGGGWVVYLVDLVVVGLNAL